MGENLLFTKVATVVGALSFTLGLASIVFAVDGFSGGQSLPGTQPWEAVPSIFLVVGCSLVVSGALLGVLCEISQNISEMRRGR